MKHLQAVIVKSAAGGPGGFTAVASAPTLDRDGEVIDAKAFDPLPPTVPLHVDHGFSTEALVGSVRPFYEGDRLLVAGTFAGTPKAQQARQLVMEGHLNRLSVGFHDAKREMRDGVPHITKAELLEVSLVSVPSNRDAVILSAKSLAELDGKALRTEVRRLASSALLALALDDLADARATLEASGPRELAASARRLAAEARAALADGAA